MLMIGQRPVAVMHWRVCYIMGADWAYLALSG